jgi:pimeloyl-ACP methyl ester carboxylesterase
MTKAGLLARSISLAAAAALALLAAAPAQRMPARGPGLAIAAKGAFFVGGKAVALRNVAPRPRIRGPGLPSQAIEPNGDFVVGATYVEYTRLARPRHEYPLLMIPGGGLSSAIYQDTPDGRPGWEWSFLARGYSIFLADMSRTGRSPWRRFPEIEAEEPAFRDNAFLWETFRIGPPGSYAGDGGKPRSFADTRFPVESFSQFAAQAAPRFRLPPEEETAAYDAVIQRVCPCILLTHSAAGPFGFAAAQRWPGLVKAVVAIEPSGGPAAVDAFPNRSLHLILWADHLRVPDTQESWDTLYQATKDYERRLRSRQVRSRWIDLPRLGIRGNSHMIMIDLNSDAVAGMIDEALRREGL